MRIALRCTERLAYLLDPLRAYADVEEPIERLSQLRVLLERFDHSAIVARAIVRGGRRVAAVTRRRRVVLGDLAQAGRAVADGNRADQRAGARHAG